MKKVRFLSSSFLMILLLLFIRPSWAEERGIVKIGVLATMSVEACGEQWRPTAVYLEERINGYRFEMVPLTYEKIYDAVKEGAVDFILANPSFYVELERWYGINRIATLKNRCASGVATTYGGVVFFRKGHQKICGWEDLKGKRFVAANEFSLGGWRIVWRELKERGIDPYKDFKELRFALSHEEAVQGVLKGEMDAGSVRTDILERMAAAGKIRLSDISIINQDGSEKEPAPFLCSTRLYPEWPMAKLQSTPDALAEKVCVALLDMAGDSPAARAAKCAGWTIPLNYQSVHDCLRILKLGPYQDQGKVSVRDVVQTYWRWLIVASLILIGSVLAVVIILKLNRRIWESHEQLKKEMAERQKTDDALQQAKELAEAATRAKSEFLANMSHEIRTPMNGVIAATELAMNEELSPKVKRYLKIIHGSAHSLLGLINDILDFSKIEAGKMVIDIRPFMLDEVLDRVVNLFANSASEKNIELLVDIHPETVRGLVGDPMRLQQILTNLVGNSVKFTENGGYILISVVMAESIPPFVTLKFKVRDTGVGIPGPYLDRLFQPFTQADGSDTRRYEGTGLGLSICKRLVEMMNGRIWVESSVGEGSTFYFTIKIERQASDERVRLKPPSEMKRLRVLVVDDCTESVALVSRMLSSFDFETDTALSGVEAIEKIRAGIESQNPFGLAIIDWRMPEMDGLETVQHIRDLHKEGLPVIMMSAFGKDQEREAAEKVGIGCFLTKPIYPSTLFNAIMDVFGRQGVKRHFATEIMDTDVSMYKRLLKGFRILVVEDNPTNSEIAVAILESAGICADTAENGKIALEKVRSQEYDAVLMDVQMPEMNGYEATRLIRSDSTLASLPVIAMTAHAMRGDEEKCIQAGMDGYISKPVHQARLFQLLWRLLKNRRPQGSGAPSSTDNQGKEKKDGSPLPDQADGLHIREVLDATRLDPAVYLKIIKGFGQNHRQAGKEIADALAKNDRSQLAMIAHTLKGSAANIGAYDVMKASENLENGLGREISPAEAVVLCDHLKAHLTALIKTISRLTGIKMEALEEEPVRAADGSWSGAPQKDTLSESLLMRLAEALKRSDPQSSREALKELAVSMNKNTFHMLERLVDNYDYEEAQAFLSDLGPSGSGKRCDGDGKE